MTLSLADLAEKMKDIDFSMLSTRAGDGQISSRPMSNNREVDYNGDSYFFTWADSRMVEDIEHDPRVALTFQGNKGLLGKPGIMVAVEGEGQVIRDKAQFEEHWSKDLNRWFKDGVDTPNLAMLKISAVRIHYWDGEDEGEVQVT